MRCTDICYSNISALDACCDCKPACGTCYFSKNAASIVQACASNTDENGNSEWSFTSSGSTPVVGDTIFNDPFGTCRPVPGAPTIPPGYYIVGVAQPSTDNPLKWVRVEVNGLVTESGTC